MTVKERNKQKMKKKILKETSNGKRDTRKKEIL